MVIFFHTIFFLSFFRLSTTFWMAFCCKRLLLIGLGSFLESPNVLLSILISIADVEEQRRSKLNEKSDLIFKWGLGKARNDPWESCGIERTKWKFWKVQFWSFPKPQKSFQIHPTLIIKISSTCQAEIFLL